MATKYDDMHKFFAALQKQVDDKIIDMDDRDARCLGSFLADKERDHSAFRMTYRQIMKAAPDYYKANMEDYSSKNPQTSGPADLLI